MPRGKRFCLYEENFFDLDEFKVIEGTLVHDVDPLHRVTDGVLLRKEGEEKVFPVSAMAFTSLAEEEEE